MKHLTISIPKPCHEKWHSLAPTAKGGFCASCQKEVIDFTGWSEERLIAYFKNKPGGCGRFMPSQLKNYPTAGQRQSRTGMFFRVVLMTILMVFSQRPTQAQAKKQVNTTEQHVKEPPVVGKLQSTMNTVVVSGVVQADEDGSLLPGVNVIHVGTNEGTVTDNEGRFEIRISNANKSDLLEFSFIGYETKSIPLKAVKGRLDLSLSMQPMVLGGIVVEHRISPRRTWRSITSFLRSVFSSPTDVPKAAPNKIACDLVVEHADKNEATAKTIVYPNPVADTFEVDLTAFDSGNTDDERNEKMISLTSMQGEIIEERISTKSKEQFNARELAAGVYVVRVEAAGTSRMIRIVKK